MIHCVKAYQEIIEIKKELKPKQIGFYMVLIKIYKLQKAY